MMYPLDLHTQLVVESASSTPVSVRSDPARNVREKEMKRQTLLELVDYANSGAGKFTEAVSEDIIFMLSNNLFRTLPPARSHDIDQYDAEEEEPSLDPSWPHLQVWAPTGCTEAFKARLWPTGYRSRQMTSNVHDLGLHVYCVRCVRLLVNFKVMQQSRIFFTFCEMWLGLSCSEDQSCIPLVDLQ